MKYKQICRQAWKGQVFMKKVAGKVLSFFYFFNCFYMFFTMPVHAYIDPSAVTYVIQAVAGVLIALGAAFTIFRHKIFKFFRGKKKENEEESKIEFKDVEEQELMRKVWYKS